MIGVDTRERRTRRSPVGGCAAAAMSKLWGRWTMTAVTQTAASGPPRRKLYGQTRSCSSRSCKDPTLTCKGNHCSSRWLMVNESLQKVIIMQISPAVSYCRGSWYMRLYNVSDSLTHTQSHKPKDGGGAVVPVLSVFVVLLHWCMRAVPKTFMLLNNNSLFHIFVLTEY